MTEMSQKPILHGQRHDRDMTCFLNMDDALNMDGALERVLAVARCIAHKCAVSPFKVHRHDSRWAVVC